MMFLSEFFALGLYVIILIFISILASRRHQTQSDFFIGGRSLNFFVTALSAHASDMSAWLFIGFPFLIFNEGLFKIWNALGLIFFMFLNWAFISKRLRIKTEKFNSLTLFSFFESCFKDTTGLIRIFTALSSLVFYTIYVSAGVIGMGIIIETLFGIDYTIGITIGISLTIIYLFVSGYRGIAWIDCFQALFLLFVIIFVPLFLWTKVGGCEAISNAFIESSISFDILPEYTVTSICSLLFIFIHFGLGYFGQPHILTKFMGIKTPSKVYKSMILGISWQFLALSAATFVGVVAVAYFSKRSIDSEYLFIIMVKETFSPFFMSFILCAVLAAILSTIDSQILVLASSLTEDFYKKIFRKKANSKELLWVSRYSILLTASLAYIIALFRVDSIYHIVFYAWAGLGASFGPLVIFSLFSKNTNRYGSWAGVLSGLMVVNIWYFFVHKESSLIVGFLISSASIYLVSLFTKRKIVKEIDVSENLEFGYGEHNYQMWR